MENAKDDIKSQLKDKKAKGRLLRFFEEVGDDQSEINKVIKGAGIAKGIVNELVKLGGKLKDLL